MARFVAIHRGLEERQKPLKRSPDKECKKKCSGREAGWKKSSERCARERIWSQSSDQH